MNRAHPIYAILFGLLGLMASCASGVSDVRFKSQPIVTTVADHDHVDAAPRNRPFLMTMYRIDSVAGSLDDGLGVEGKSRAQDVNALGEVPDSTWFTNRMGVREVSLEEIRKGPRVDAGPMGAKPWTVVSTKVGGLAPGIQFIDAAGVRYLLKFDRPGLPDLDTGADVVVQRLLWAFGYHTPADDVVYFARDELILAEDAEVKDLFGNERPMTEQDLDEILGGRDGPVDGKYRGLTSRFLDGKPLGGYRRDGVRDDDPNDTIPHQHRRSVRGQVVPFAWLGHTDVKVDNTLDMFVETDEGNHVRHYLVDFGNALGVWAFATPLPWSGFKHAVDVEYGTYSLFTLGLWTRPWEKVPDASPGIPGVGWFESNEYAPDLFKSNQYYTPYRYTDRFDAFWAAAIMMQFTPAQIEAAVESADYRDPRASEYLTRTLIERQRKTGRFWFAQVNPLDRFRVTGDRLCFSDLWITYAFGEASTTSYALEAFDRRGRRKAWARQVAAGEHGEACVDELPQSGGPDGYTIIKLVTHRGSRSLEPVELHLARTEPEAGLQPIGVWRR